jgi:hypothetical protein
MSASKISKRRLARFRFLELDLDDPPTPVVDPVGDAVVIDQVEVVED